MQQTNRCSDKILFQPLEVSIERGGMSILGTRV